MEILNLVQDTPEWHRHRATALNASEAPAMLGISPYKSRADLIRERATGITPEVTPEQQRIFDRGHAIEALARPLAEQIIGEDLSPCVGTDGTYSASFDGITFGGDVAWECKSLNAALREALPYSGEVHDDSYGARLPEHYRAQMEQQAMVSWCERVLFTAASIVDGTLDDIRHCWYTPDPELRARIVAGWKQFANDVAAYTPEPPKAAPVVAAPQETLPAVSVRVDGQLAIVSNLPAFGQALRAFIDKIPAEPSTDQEFADVESACKSLKNAEEALEAAESNALAQLADVDTMRRFVADYRALARTTRLQREKLVAIRKDEIRRDIVNEGVHALRKHIAELNAAMPADYMPTVSADFAGAIKGKRTVDSLRDAVSTELSRARIEASTIANRIHTNIQIIRKSGLVVPDVATLVLKASDDLEAVLAQRVAAEAARLEAERERIRQEEERKAREAAEREAEKERQRIRAEEQDKARREAEALAEQHERERQAELAQAVLLHRQRNQQEAQRLIEENRPALEAAAEQMRDLLPAKSGAPGICFRDPSENIDETTTGDEPDNEPSLNLGEINARLAPISVSASGLADLGIDPVGRERRAVLYSEAQFPRICRAIAQHAIAAAQAVAA